MEKVKIIFRKSKNPYTNEYEVVAFFPEAEVNYTRILTYMHIGQHNEADMRFYHESVKATEEEYRPLLEEIKTIYDDCELVIRQRINYHDLIDKAWKRI